MRLLIFGLSLLLSVSALPALAQKTSSSLFPTRTETLWFADSAHHRERGVELGLALGGLYYFGDLAKEGPLTFQHWQKGMGGLYLRRRFWAFMALKAQAMMGSMSSEDLAYPQRRSSFETSLRDISLQVEWEPLARRRFRKTDTVHYVLDRYQQIAVVNRTRFFPSPYVFVGGGLMSSKATPKFDRVYSEAANLMSGVEQDMRLAGTWQNNFGLSFGGGMHLDLGKNWAFGLELSARTAFSDYLDGISQAANPNRTDWYWLAAVQLAYRLGKHDRDGDGIADRHDKCPQIPGKGRSHGCPDADNDGIADRDDECPHRAGIASLSGCPLKDADNDGVPDVDDECPKVAGLPKFRGCPDTDHDGVEDRQDSCATVPGEVWFAGCPDIDRDSVQDKYDLCPNVAGLPQFKGCPDTDGDGIEDKDDQCPNEKGIFEYGGCAWRDTDRDSVEDRFDPCPTVPGLKQFYGCPDTDGDGVQDRLDLCPNLPGKAENRGCPVVEKKDQKKLELAVKAVKFETGKAILKPESSKILTDIADILVRYEGYHLRIEGHTDNVGKDDTNQKLSEDRARACADFLIQKGVQADRLVATGFGESKPVADNKSATGKASNRRVEFHLFLPEG